MGIRNVHINCKILKWFFPVSFPVIIQTQEIWCKVANKTLGPLQSMRVKWKKVGSLIWKWSPKVSFRSVMFDPQLRVMALELERFHDFLNLFFWFLSAKARSLPLFICRGIDFFNSLSSGNWNLGKRRNLWHVLKFQYYLSEVAILHDAVLTISFY